MFLLVSARRSSHFHVCIVRSCLVWCSSALLARCYFEELKIDCAIDQLKPALKSMVHYLLFKEPVSRKCASEQVHNIRLPQHTNMPNIKNVKESYCRLLHIFIYIYIYIYINVLMHCHCVYAPICSHMSGSLETINQF